MRFKCGLTTKEQNAARLAKWAEWERWKLAFAWWPVEIDRGRCVWLEHYEHRKTWVTGSFSELGGYWRYEKRTVDSFGNI